MTDPLAYLAAALDAAQRDAEYSRDEFMFFDTGDERVADHYQRAGSPEAVLRRIAADRKMIADLTAEKHQACEDSWYNCSAADEYGKRDGNQECDCGRDERVERRVRLIAEGWGWTEDAT